MDKDYHKGQMLGVSHQDALLITEKREQKVSQVKLLSATKGIYHLQWMLLDAGTASHLQTTLINAEEEMRVHNFLNYTEMNSKDILPDRDQSWLFQSSSQI